MKFACFWVLSLSLYRSSLMELVKLPWRCRKARQLKEKTRQQGEFMNAMNGNKRDP
jgi:hypothetical protein